jgi:hypothetical protein
VLAHVSVGVILHCFSQLQQHIHQVLYLQAGQAGTKHEQPGMSSQE